MLRLPDTKMRSWRPPCAPPHLCCLAADLDRAEGMLNHSGRMLSVCVIDAILAARAAIAMSRVVCLRHGPSRGGCSSCGGRNLQSWGRRTDHASANESSRAPERASPARD